MRSSHFRVRSTSTRAPHPKYVYGMPVFLYMVYRVVYLRYTKRAYERATCRHVNQSMCIVVHPWHTDQYISELYTMSQLRRKLHAMP